MKRSHRAAVGIAAALSLCLAATAFAHPEQAGGGMEHGMRHGAMGSGGAGHMAGQQLMTPEERSALQEKMRNAQTPEERQKLAEATRAEMQRRAEEKGVASHQHRGPGAGIGPDSGMQSR